MKRSATLATLALAVPGLAPAQTVTIDHEGVGCVVAERHPRWDEYVSYDAPLRRLKGGDHFLCVTKRRGERVVFTVCRYVEHDRVPGVGTVAQQGGQAAMDYFADYSNPMTSQQITALKAVLRGPAYAGLSDADAAALAATPVRVPKSTPIKPQTLQSSRMRAAPSSSGLTWGASTGWPIATA